LLHQRIESNDISRGQRISHEGLADLFALHRRKRTPRTPPGDRACRSIRFDDEDEASIGREDVDDGIEPIGENRISIEGRADAPEKVAREVPHAFVIELAHVGQYER
jgi:hypothetical protein